MAELQINSLNARGLREVKKRKELFNILRMEKSDIVCLQETHSTPQDETEWCMQSNMNVVYSHGDSNAQGVCIMYKKQKNINITCKFHDKEGRYVGAEVKYKHRNFILVNVYCPNEDNPNFFLELFKQIAKLDTAEIIIVGDFNLVLQPTLDRKDFCRYKPKAFEILSQFIDEMELLDLWRCRNPQKRFYSWSRTKNKKLSASRIDFFLVSAGIANSTSHLEYTPGYKTDHALLTLKLDVGDGKRGPGFWKFNSRMLHDHVFVKKCNQIIDESDAKYQHCNSADKWELLKRNLTLWAKKRGRQLSADRNIQYDGLKKKLSQIETELYQAECKGNINEILQAHKESIYKKIEELIEIQTSASVFRSRCKYVKDNEKNTKFFYSLEKANYNKKNMTHLKTDNGNVITSPKDILCEQEKFYKELYRKDEKVKFNLTNNSGIFISDEEKRDLDSPFQEWEVAKAVKSFKGGKVPGLDGLNAEFFQFFFSRIKNVFCDALNYAKSIGILHESARRGVITLIPKNKDPLLLKNWRPLTMLSQDQKILAKILALRLKQVLPKIISESQNGFMENRNISNTWRIAIDIAKYGKNITGYILSLDFDKCFDRISYDAIRGSLRYFNFGKEYIEWVSLLLDNFKVCTMNNGYTSAYFPVGRSCHQGCPLAPSLYLLCGEVLAHKIKENSGIQGIIIGELESLIAQFADDTQMFLANRESVEQVISTLAEIETNTGLKVNYEKTSIHPIREVPHIKCSKPIVWDPGKLEILGIDLDEDSEKFYAKTLDKAQKVLKTWYYRRLTLYGKVLIINTLIASLFVYGLQSLEDPQEKTIHKFNTMIQEFLWKGKKAKIKFDLLQNNYQKGGLKLIDLTMKNKSLKITQLFNTNEFISNQINLIIPDAMGVLFFECGIHPKQFETVLEMLGQAECNIFWKQALSHWFQLTWICVNSLVDNITQARHQVIWLNSNIKINGQMLYRTDYIMHGLMYLDDILDENDRFLSIEMLNDKLGCKFNWLWYRALLLAIPKQWLKNNIELRPNVTETVRELYHKIEKAKRRPKIIYDLLLEKKDETSTKHYYKMMRKKISITYDEYCEAYVNIKKITNVTKYRDFQYRLLNNAIFTNGRLFYWNKVETQKCDFCNEPKQTVQHLFFECEITQ